MNHPVLMSALAESCQQLPEAIAAVCVDLRSGDILASETRTEMSADPSALAGLAARVFAGGRQAGLNRLWKDDGQTAEGGDEVVLLELDRCYVVLRPLARPHYAVVLMIGRSADVGLIIARMRAVKASFEEALRRL